MYFRRFVNTDFGRSLLSIILGLGIASLVRKSCDSVDGECYKFIGANYENKIKGNVFKYNGNCYQYELNPVSRDNNKKLLQMETH